MDDKEYMSGCQLRQYLHISTRKMKYLMDYNYIPHENTGHATHKYRVKREDAETFRLRMEQEPNFLRELSGQFSSRTTRSPKRPMIDPTEENCRGFEAFLTDLWAELPDALPATEAATLAGYAPQRIREFIKENVLSGVKVGAVQYIVKDEFIAYLSSSENLSKPRTSAYCELIRKFKRRQYRLRENEKRRITRQEIRKNRHV